MFGSAPARKLAVALASREDRNIRRRLRDSSHSLVDSRCHFRRHLSGYHHQSHTATASASDLLQQLPPPLSLSGGIHLVHNHAHEALEARLLRTFRFPTALLFNSGFDANGVFNACMPQLTPYSTMGPTTPCCTTVRASQRACLIPQHTMTCVRCALRSGRFRGTQGRLEQCIRRRGERA